MTTLVTGATGLLGNNIVRALVQRARAVRVLVRENSDPRALEGLEVEKVYGDIRELAKVREACTGVETVIHSAGYVRIGWTNLQLARAINVQGSRNVAEAALEVGAKMVHVSTCDTMAPGQPGEPANEQTPGEKPPCTYVTTKREGERAVLEKADDGLHVVVVNPGFMLGPWDWKPSSGRMLLEVAQRFTPAAPPGGMSLCDVRDVADAVLAAAEKGQPRRRYILAGHNMTYFKGWELFAQVAGAKPPLVEAGPIGLTMAGWFGDLWTHLSGREGDVNSAAIKMASVYHYYSSARAEAELGYRSRPAEVSVRDAWQWFVQHGYVGQRKRKDRDKPCR
jgi:dihydroflavonol-4-reductase